jgi:hypothetical protein
MIPPRTKTKEPVVRDQPSEVSNQEPRTVFSRLSSASCSLNPVSPNQKPVSRLQWFNDDLLGIFSTGSFLTAMHPLLFARVFILVFE